MRIKISAKLARSFTGIVPLLERSIDAAMREAADEALVLYRKTTRTWKTTVNFYVRKTKQGYSVGTRSAIFTYVDRGTRAHIIRARRAPFLAFTYPTRAKTKPRVISSYNGSRGTNWARKKEVRHPGGKARQFTETINVRITKRLGTITRRRLADILSRRKS